MAWKHHDKSEEEVRVSPNTTETAYLNIDIRRKKHSPGVSRTGSGMLKSALINITAVEIRVVSLGFSTKVAPSPVTQSPSEKSEVAHFTPVVLSKM